MFSVPGWNVSAPLATQVEKPKPADPAKLGKKAQKRKRKLEEQIDADNVGEYWDRVIGGKGGDSVPASEAKAPVAADGAASNGAQEKKARKRRKKNKDTNGNIVDADHGESEVADSKPMPKTQPNAPAEPPSSPQKDSDSKRDKKKRKKDRKTEPTTSPAPTTAAIPKPADHSSLLPEPKGLTPLQISMRQKLASARFRHLNEALYTKPSAESLSLLESDPSMFEDYHRGFAQQVQVWPENPVDGYIDTILARGKLRPTNTRKDKYRRGQPQKDATDPSDAAAALQPLPRNYKGHCTIADLGCGTASLAYRLQPHLAPLHLTLHSFDLAKPSGPSAPLVTVADIAALPLPDASVDIAIFCLALMGTNWLDFVDEAYRVLRWRGELWVAEIKSRFGRVERGKGQGPVNSVGSLKKKKGGKGKVKRDVKEHEEGIQGSEDEAELATRIDGVEAQSGTDVSAFTAILLKHGFALDARPERPSDAIDMSNRMFVKLSFTKSATPTTGKNAQKVGGEAKAGSGAENAFGPRAAAGFQGKGGLKMGIKGKKFTAIAEEDGEDGEGDAKVLKPCLYKIR